MLLTRLLLLPCAALALMKMPRGVNESTLCAAGLCERPALAYEWAADVQPGYQWGDAGGYCGSFATQRAAMAKGAWISQQQVRDHTTHAPGAPASHDNEILSSNIDEALRRLKLRTATGPRTCAFPMRC